MRDWFDSLKTRIAGTSKSRSEHQTDTSMVPKNHQEGRKTQSQIQTLASAIDALLSWQENGLRLKMEAKQRAMQKRYRDKYVENKALM